MVVVLRSSSPGAHGSPEWHWSLAKSNMVTYILVMLGLVLAWTITRGWDVDVFKFWTMKVLVAGLVFPFGAFAVWDFVRSWMKVREVKT